MIDYPRYKKVLFCTDFSKISDCAFDEAFGMAKRDDAMLYILHVMPALPIPPSYAVEAYFSQKQLNKIEADQKAYADKMFHDKYLRCIQDRTQIKIVTDHGREDDIIIAFAQKEKIDIIVIGTHGRTGIEHVFLGSVAERVIRRSPIPVLVTPYRDKNRSA